MTLRQQINLIVAVLTLAFVAAVLGLQWRSLRESVHEEVVAANRVAAQLLDRTVWRYAAQGTPTMLAFLQGMGRVRSNDISLFDADGRALYSSPPSPYKAGRDAPAWFAALVSPPPAEQSIAFPGGTKLVVRANASRAVVDAWDDAVVLVGVALTLLAAVNGLVFWLVGRAVRPFGRIVQALNAMQAGRFDVALPALQGREAAAIGAAFNRMVAELQHHIETERRAVRAERQLSDSRELSRWVDQQIEQERLMIARELHDEFGQSVTAMRSMALSIARRVGPTDAESENAARVIADEALRLYDAMHGIIPRLTPLVLDNFGLAEALEDLVERTRRSQAAVDVRLTVNVGDAPLGADAALTLYRAAQEGLTNALRHGRAARIDIVVTAAASTGEDGKAGDVALTVTDDGEGLPAAGRARAGHHGLRWLAERVAGVGGTMQIDAAAPRGTRLAVRVPIGAATAAVRFVGRAAESAPKETTP